jgi:hypothetical protein
MKETLWNTSPQESNSSRYDRVMQPEQFEQVLEAISSGHYSWACVLILRFAGYNPLHYIPYRTYRRLEKENRDRTSQSSPGLGPSIPGQQDSSAAETQIQDLEHVASAQRLATQVRGSRFRLWFFDSWI